MEEHKLSAGEDLIEKVDLVLVDALYHVRRDRRNGSAEYDMFASEDMKDIEKILGDTMRVEVHAHFFCSVLQTTVEMQLRIEIESSAFNHTCAVENFQVTTAKNCAVHASMVERSIHFWLSGAS